MNILIKAALYYREELNLSIIPIIPGDKKAMVAWSNYQNKLPTIDEIKAWWKKTPMANIGIITGKINKIVIVDLDKYKPEYSEEKVLEYFPESLKTPTVTSPSGGTHLYFKYPEQSLSNNAGAIAGVDFRANGGYIVAPPSSNKQGKKYAWVEKLGIADIPFASLPEKYISILNNKNTYVFKRRNTECKAYAKNAQLFQQGRRDQDLFHLANSLIKGRMPEEEIYQYLEFIARHCIPPYPEKDIGIKIKSALQRAEKQGKNISQEIRDFVLSSNGQFLSNEIHQCLILSNRKEKKLCSQVLTTLVKDDIIERVGNRNGMFRLIDSTAPDIDLHAPKQEALKVEFPLNLHAYYKAMPKNIIIVAGTVDAGKTAFMLRAASMNTFGPMKIRYQTSEMGVEELQSRLELFSDIEAEDWDKINFKEVSTNHQDYILPDGINIIDYLEITSNFYEIGGMIKSIFAKLRKGIAIIAIQKDTEAEYGRGGMFSAEKARLYVSLTSNPPAGGIAKIVKCKNWKNTRVNPNGRQCTFKIRDGNELRMVESDWKHPVK